MEQKTLVSWLLLEVEASKIYFEPRSQLAGLTKSEAKSGILSCPAVLARLQRTFTISAPYDLHLRFTGTALRPEVRPVLSGCSITPVKLKQVFSLSPREQWISDQRPVFQLTTPYVFFSSAICYINQVFPRELIGLGAPFRLIEGRFPIHAWKRPLSWAVEWVDLKKDVVVKRGQPWFNVFFETENPNNHVRLARSKVTDDLRSEILANKDVTSYIKGTSKLFEA